MMNTTYETYMNALKQGLASFDSAAAEEILNDFESHFADARSQGLSDEEICAELGNVDDVLEFFRQEYATTEQPVANVLPQEKNSISVKIVAKRKQKRFLQQESIHGKR